MHHDQGGPGGVPRQGGVEPGGSLGVDRAVMRARHRHVEPDDPNRPEIVAQDVERAGGGQVGVMREGAPEGFALVVVARDGDERRAQPGQQGPGQRVFVVPPLVDDVARQQHDIGLRIEPGELAQRRREARIGIDEALIELPGGSEVRVGDLGDEHDARVACVGRLPTHSGSKTRGWSRALAPDRLESYRRAAAVTPSARRPDPQAPNPPNLWITCGEVLNRTGTKLPCPQEIDAGRGRAMTTLREFEDALREQGMSMALAILQSLKDRDRARRTAVAPARRLTGQKMTPELARRILELHGTTGMTQQEIAFKVGVNQGRVNEVIKRGKWLDGDPNAPEAKARDKAKARIAAGPRLTAPLRKPRPKGDGKLGPATERGKGERRAAAPAPVRDVQLTFL